MHLRQFEPGLQSISVTTSTPSDKVCHFAFETERKAVREVANRIC